MVGISLVDIRDKYGLAASVCEHAPTDTTVLFHIAGRINTMRVESIVRALYEPNYPSVSEYAQRDIGLYCPPNSAERSLSIFRGRRLWAKNRFHHVLSETMANATEYGFDGFVAPYSMGQLFTDGLIDTPALRMSLHKGISGYAAIVMAYAPSKDKLYLLVQNLVSEKAANDVVDRYGKANAENIQDEKLFRALPKTDGYNADPKNQPLLQMGGPVGSISMPLSFLRKTHRHDPAGIGIKSVRTYAKNPVLVDHSEVPLASLQHMKQRETLAALDLARSSANLRPEQIRAVTVGVQLTPGQ